MMRVLYSVYQTHKVANKLICILYLGGMPGAGAGGMPDIATLLSDPELLQAFQVQ